MNEKQSLTISVAAGKGGTGKTLISTSLALALHEKYKGTVNIFDCDVEEPNVHLLMYPEIKHEETISILVPFVDKNKCSRCGKCAEVCQYNAIAVIKNAILTFPELCNGCGACSYICPDNAIDEITKDIGVVSTGFTPENIEFHSGMVNIGVQRSGPVTKAVKRFIHHEMINIIDAPPGTACPMQETVSQSDFCILVTEPTPFGFSDLKLAIETCNTLNVPCGIIINRDGETDPGIRDFCKINDIPILLTIPINRKIAEAYSKGITLAAAIPEWKPKLVKVYHRIIKIINSLNGGEEYAGI